MFQDICFPKNNEKEFVEMALKLGTKALIFVYPWKDKKSFEAQKKKIEEIKELKADIGILADKKSVSKLSNTDDYVFCSSPPRELVENKRTYILYDFEISSRPDFAHHRNSGLNQVLCKEMKEKGKILGFSFSTLLNSKNKGIIMGRMQQNAKFARKYKLKSVAATFAKDPYELRGEHEINSFERVLGI